MNQSVDNYFIKGCGTRLARIEKCMPMIMNGIGLHDKYKSMKK